jgi:hypothetical protein
MLPLGAFRIILPPSAIARSSNQCACAGNVTACASDAETPTITSDARQEGGNFTCVNVSSSRDSDIAPSSTIGSNHNPCGHSSAAGYSNRPTRIDDITSGNGLVG